MNLDPIKKLMYHQNFEEAEKLLQKSLKTEKDKFMILYFLGLVHFELRNVEKSIFFFKKSIKLRPNNISSYLKLAALYQTMGDIDSSINNFLKVIELDSNQIRGYYGLYQLSAKFLKDEYHDQIKKISKNSKDNSVELAISEFLLSKFEISKNNFKKECSLLDNAHKKMFNSDIQFHKQSNFYYKRIMSKNYNKIQLLNYNDEKKKIYKTNLYNRSSKDWINFN